LVVGGNGFIGHHVVNRAVQCGWQVTSLSLPRRTEGEETPPEVRQVIADIADRETLKPTLEDAAFEYVVNCGGYIDHTPFFSGGRNVIETHLGGVLNLVQSLDRGPLRAFVSIGSSDEYGASPAPRVETQREAPISPYSFAKVAATQFLQMLHRTESFPATTLRLFLVYGPGQDERRFLPQIIRGCLENRSFPASEGQQLRDFCYVQDIVEAVFAALASPAAKGEVINIGSGQPVSIREMIEAVRKLVGQGVPLFGKIAYRRGENMELYADISKAKSLLHWEPKVTLTAGLKKTIQWMIQRG
jgi:nucleoside-diphosphate-sugar epimerase